MIIIGVSTDRACHDAQARTANLTLSYQLLLFLLFVEY